MARRKVTEIPAVAMVLGGLLLIGLLLLGAKLLIRTEAEGAGADAGEGFLAGITRGVNEFFFRGEDDRGLWANTKAWWERTFGGGD